MIWFIFDPETIILNTFFVSVESSYPLDVPLSLVPGSASLALEVPSKKY